LSFCSLSATYKRSRRETIPLTNIIANKKVATDLFLELAIVDSLAIGFVARLLKMLVRILKVLPRNLHGRLEHIDRVLVKLIPTLLIYHYLQEERGKKLEIAPSSRSHSERPAET